MNNPEDNQLENKDWREGFRDWWVKKHQEQPIGLRSDEVEKHIQSLLDKQAEKQMEELSKYTAHHLDCDWQEDNECDCGLVNILYPREDLTNNRDE